VAVGGTAGAGRDAVTAPEEGGSGADRSEADRRRRRAEVFGDVLPASTRDDRDSDGSQERSADVSADDWLRSNVPPHHG
jgi:hypothetical protein